MYADINHSYNRNLIMDLSKYNKTITDTYLEVK